MTPITAYVQARMSSRRFPGKVLTAFRGRPIVHHVVDAVAQALPDACVVVATSDDPSDDPLAAFVASIGVPVFRGPLQNVLERFRLCAAAYPCEWILRINADSPMLRPHAIRAVAAQAHRTDCDLVTTIFPRTWPKGQNAELIRTQTLLSLDPATVSADDAEHVTAHFYRHPSRFRIVNVASSDRRLAELDFAVDTVEDLERLQTMTSGEIDGLLAATPAGGASGSVAACSE